MNTCRCTQTEITVVVRLLILCVYHRRKAETHKVNRLARVITKICDSCRDQMRAQDDGWTIDLENGSACSCGN